MSSAEIAKEYREKAESNMFGPSVLLLNSPDYMVTAVTDQMLIWPVVVNW